MAFPHMAIFCLTARKMSQFKKTVTLYPLCIAAIWLPCVFLGLMANRAADVPEIRAKQEARRTLATQGATLAPEAREELREKMAGDDVLLLLLDRYAPLWLAGLLGAGIMAAVMASDSQILALSTMFTEDVFTHYGGTARFGERVQVLTGRVFVVLVTVFAYSVAMNAPANIFELAIQYALSGYAALSPLLIAALFWRRSTRWGALAVALWTAAAVAAIAVFQALVPAAAPGHNVVALAAGGWDVVTRTPGGTTVLGFMPVVPMVLVSAVLMIVVSLLTPGPTAATLGRYFAVREPGGSTPK
jgi:SSS family solute:Na+ symporter